MIHDVFLVAGFWAEIAFELAVDALKFLGIVRRGAGNGYIWPFERIFPVYPQHFFMAG